MKTIIILITLLTMASQGEAVSRIGGGKIQSEADSFQMLIENPFDVSNIANNSVRCIGPVSLIPQPPTASLMTQFFEVSELKTEFPDAVTLSKDQLISRFGKSNWRDFSGASCTLQMRLSNQTTIAYLVTWGAGKGFVMKGTATQQTDQVMQKALQSLKFEGGCQWK